MASASAAGPLVSGLEDSWNFGERCSSLLSEPFWDRFWNDFWPKSVQNRFQMDPKSVQNQFRDHLRFRGRFWFGSDAILDPTWAHLGGQVGAKLGTFWHLRQQKVTFLHLKLQSKNVLKLNCLLDSSWGRFWDDFGSQNGSKMGPKRELPKYAKT